jgi:hypothetical protein
VVGREERASSAATAREVDASGRGPGRLSCPPCLSPRHTDCYGVGRGAAGGEDAEPARLPPLLRRPVPRRLPQARLPQLRGDPPGASARSPARAPATACSRAPRPQMRGSQDRIATCTTTHWDGMIAVVNPDQSWVARWQRTSERAVPAPPAPAVC